MAPLAVTKRRQKAVDFTNPFLETSMAVLIRKQFGISNIEELLDSIKVFFYEINKIK